MPPEVVVSAKEHLKEVERVEATVVGVLRWVWKSLHGHPWEHDLLSHDESTCDEEEDDDEDGVEEKEGQDKTTTKKKDIPPVVSEIVIRSEEEAHRLLELARRAAPYSDVLCAADVVLRLSQWQYAAAQEIVSILPWYLSQVPRTLPGHSYDEYDNLE